jgi:acetyl esterase/lipase
MKGLVLWLPKSIAGALALCWAILGTVGAVIGWAYDAIWAIPMGILGAGMMIGYIWRSSRDHGEFEKAFGANWSDQIPLERTRYMVKRRWSPYLKMKASPEYSWERDMPFCTVPGTNRQLLCDIWRPANSKSSGLGFVYIHGGGWYFMDKDMLTRPFFRHLVAQGHTVMDVSYRLCPEVDVYGMIGDVKRAIAWMKANAAQYGVNPDKIVLGGGSAGAHLALLAGYTPQHPELTPEDLVDADLSVSGVVSYYPPADMQTMYQYSEQQQFADRPPVSTGPDTSISFREDFGRMDIFLGGWPQDIPDAYELASPVTHIHPGSPPTLLFHGSQDGLAPADITRALYAKLVDSGVPAVGVVFPWTNHAFDLLLPQLSPPAQSALYDVDRFLALILNNDVKE